MPGYTGSVPITGFIAPTDTNDTYPVVDPLYGIDGLRNVPTDSDLDTIPASRRRQGMVVGSIQSGNYFRLLAPPWSFTSADWANFLSIPAPGNIPRTQYYITGGSVSIPQYYQYLVYGNVTIGASGSLYNDGQVIIINGTLSFISNGTYSGNGTITYLTDFSKVNSLQPFTFSSYGVGPNLAQPNVKYSASFSSSANIPLTITHSLATTDITYSVREDNNFITANVVINDANSVILTTDANITNGRINIIG